MHLSISSLYICQYFSATSRFKWMNFEILNIWSWFYLINFDGLIDALRRSYVVTPDDSKDFIMIKICPWNRYRLYFHFCSVFVMQDTYLLSKFCAICMEISMSNRLKSLTRLIWNRRKRYLISIFLIFVLKKYNTEVCSVLCFQQRVKNSMTYKQCQIKFF